MAWTSFGTGYFSIDDILGFQTMNQVTDNMDFLENAGVGTSYITNLAVTTGKIANLDVTTGKINDLAVTTAKLNDLAVTVAKLAGSITFAKMAAIVKTGTYTGDGTTSKAITGVTFSPAAVIILRNSIPAGGTSGTWMRIAGMSFAVNGHGEESTDAIISLDGDGFTVDDAGANDDPNANTKSYYYMAWK